MNGKEQTLITNGSTLKYFNFGICSIINTTSFFEKFSKFLLFRSLSMQMVRQHITRRQTPAGAEPADSIDLDEKIRRIQEKNKEREQRFREIEQDKKLAMGLPLEIKTSCKKDIKDELPKNKLHKNAISKPQQSDRNTRNMKGVHGNNKKTAKGRGEKLLEMSHHPLKAESFESRTKNRSANFCQILPETIKLKNNCRSRICEKIKTKSDKGRATKTVHDHVKKVEENSNFVPKDRCNEVSKEVLPEQSKESDHITKDAKLEDIQEETHIKSLNDNPKETLESCESNQQTDTHTDLSDNLEENKEQQNEKITDTATSETQFGTKSKMQKSDKPKITVKLKKTASSSSFDESMAMLSPLDLPQNWGDLDFSDDELPPVSLWKN